MDDETKIICIVNGDAKRLITQEEMEILREIGVIVCNDEPKVDADMFKELEESIKVIEEMPESVEEVDNHAWKKSNKHKHPAFKKK